MSTTKVTKTKPKVVKKPKADVPKSSEVSGLERIHSVIRLVDLLFSTFVTLRSIPSVAIEAQHIAPDGFTAQLARDETLVSAASESPLLGESPAQEALRLSKLNSSGDTMG